jgi:hypothetical protein
VVVFGGGQRRHRVDEQQRRVPGVVQDAADLGDAAADAGGGLAVHHHDRADGVAGVGGQLGSKLLGAGAVAPVAGDGGDLEAEVGSDVAPQDGELAGVEADDAVARGQRVDHRRLPGAGARRRVDHHRAHAVEDGAEARQKLAHHGGKLRAAMVDGGHGDGAQNAVRHVGGPGDLQEVAPCVPRHRSSLTRRG